MVAMPDGTWAALEIRLGAHQIDEAAAKLLKVQKVLSANDGPHAAPKVLCVLCGLASAAYQRPDGVFVLPLTALRP